MFDRWIFRQLFDAALSTYTYLLGKAQVLDVRQSEELDGRLSYIAGAQCIPLSELYERLGDVSSERQSVSLCWIRSD